MLRCVPLLALVALLVCGCSRRSAPSPGPERAAPWPPRTGKHDAEAAKAPQGARPVYELSSGDPWKTKFKEVRLGAVGFLPMPSEQVTGTLRTTLGPLQKDATFANVAWAYPFDPRAPEQLGDVVAWGACVTRGELLIARDVFLNPPPNRRVHNHFTCEDYGPDCLLIKLDRDPVRGRHDSVCVLKEADGKLTVTAGWIGSVAEHDGTKMVRGAHGWERLEAQPGAREPEVAVPVKTPGP